jgi:hypothetical protein
MSTVYPFPRDERPSALYLLAHQGPLRNPHPVEVQHMRIRRYMDLLAEGRGVHHHYSEAHDVYVDFNFTGSGEAPALMRLGEAIAGSRYRAVFVDLAGISSFTGTSSRDIAYSKIEYTLRQLPIEVIDVGADPAGVLLDRLRKLSTKWGSVMRDYMADGDHDLVCFFPGLAASVAGAVFFRDEDFDDRVRRRLESLERENPYSGGREPWLPETIWNAFYIHHVAKEREEEQAARRSSGETLYRIDPDRDSVLIDEGLWSAEAPRSVESMAMAEGRLMKFGFDKVVDGAVVSFQLSASSVIFFADPRREGKIQVRGFRLEPTKRKRGKPQWKSVGEMYILDSWWLSNPGNRFKAALQKQFAAVLDEHLKGPAEG